MKMSDFGQMVQIIANLGVLVGIFLLVYELNQNRQMVQAQTRSSISDTLVEIMYGQAMSEEFSALMVKLQAGEPMSPVERRRFDSYETAMWRYRENVHYQYRKGLFEATEYEAQREGWREFLNENPLLHDIWCVRRNRMSAEFVQEIDKLLDQPC